jgi:hypothetical protein
MSQFQQSSASTEEDVQLTQLITEGKNARGIPSAKFIVRLRSSHASPHRWLFCRKMSKNILLDTPLNLLLVPYKIYTGNISIWSKVLKNQKQFINLNSP